MRRIPSRQSEDAFSFIVLVVGAVIIGIVLLAIVRLGKGLLGVVLAGLAAVILVYWLREIYKLARQERLMAPTKRSAWDYDVIEAQNEVTVVAEVPGPEEAVKVELNDNTLQITGGGDFQKTLTLPDSLEILGMTYVNGVLNLRLKKSGG